MVKGHAGVKGAVPLSGHGGGGRFIVRLAIRLVHRVGGRRRGLVIIIVASSTGDQSQREHGQHQQQTQTLQ
jgi:hypothetical protein